MIKGYVFNINGDVNRKIYAHSISEAKEMLLEELLNIKFIGEVDDFPQVDCRKIQIAPGIWVPEVIQPDELKLFRQHFDDD